MQTQIDELISKLHVSFNFLFIILQNNNNGKIKEQEQSNERLKEDVEYYQSEADNNALLYQVLLFFRFYSLVFFTKVTFNLKGVSERTGRN